jgi:NADPH:quinone reductase-like Zn-dependent oxidoreductase
MRAVRFHRQGPPEVLQVDTIDDPEPGPGEVLIDVKACSVNHLDVWVRRELPNIPTPRIPGADAAGVVAAVGAGVSRCAVGDRVLIDPGIACGACTRCIEGDASLCATYGIQGETCDGTYAERKVVRERAVLPMPAGWSFAEAASFPLVALTAWRMMLTRGRLQPTETVLILGAAAGVGVLCIQIARLAGCRVIATASSADKRDLCLALGADHAIDYTQAGWQKEVRSLCPGGVDVTVDYVGQATWRDSVKATRSGGRILTCGATTGAAPSAELTHVFFRQLSVIGSTMGSRADLEAALRAADRGLLRPVLDRTLPLADAAIAHRLIEDRAVLGKLALGME